MDLLISVIVFITALLAPIVVVLALFGWLLSWIFRPKRAAHEVYTHESLAAALSGFEVRPTGIPTVDIATSVFGAVVGQMNDNHVEFSTHVKMFGSFQEVEVCFARPWKGGLLLATNGTWFDGLEQPPASEQVRVGSALDARYRIMCGVGGRAELLSRVSAAEAALLELDSRGIKVSIDAYRAVFRASKHRTQDEALETIQQAIAAVAALEPRAPRGAPRARRLSSRFALYHALQRFTGLRRAIGDHTYTLHNHPQMSRRIPNAAFRLVGHIAGCPCVVSPWRSGQIKGSLEGAEGAAFFRVWLFGRGDRTISDFAARAQPLSWAPLEFERYFESANKERVLPPREVQERLIALAREGCRICLEQGVLVVRLSLADRSLGYVRMVCEKVVLLTRSVVG